MKLLTSLAVVATAAFTTVAFAGELPDLDAKEVVFGLQIWRLVA